MQVVKKLAVVQFTSDSVPNETEIDGEVYMVDPSDITQTVPLKNPQRVVGGLQFVNVAQILQDLSVVQTHLCIQLQERSTADPQADDIIDVKVRVEEKKLTQPDAGYEFVKVQTLARKVVHDVFRGRGGRFVYLMYKTRGTSKRGDWMRCPRIIVSNHRFDTRPGQSLDLQKGRKNNTFVYLQADTWQPRVSTFTDKVALIIANTYAGAANPLPYTKNGAEALCESIRHEFGDCVLLIDANVDATKAAVAALTYKVKKLADEGHVVMSLIYFNGHGGTDKHGQQFISCNDGNRFHLNQIYKQLKTAKRSANVQILGCCRKSSADRHGDMSPFKQSEKALILHNFRSQTSSASPLHTLAMYEGPDIGAEAGAGAGAVVAEDDDASFMTIFSSDPGELSYGASRPNGYSMYATALLKLLPTYGHTLPLHDFFSKVGRETQARAKKHGIKQRPWINTNMNLDVPLLDVAAPTIAG